MSATSLWDGAAEAALCADRLQYDIASLMNMLANYTHPSPAREPLAAPVSRARRQLEAISQRMSGLGLQPVETRHQLSDQENAALDAARELRTRMMETLARLHRLEHSANRPKT